MKFCKLIASKFLLASVISLFVLLVGCGPTKWGNLRDAESENRADVRAHCNTQYTTNEVLCGQARDRKSELSARRAAYVQQEKQECENAKDEYDRDLAEYDREIDQYNRELDRYDRCLERSAQSTYASYCAYLLRPSKPSKILITIEC